MEGPKGAWSLSEVPAFVQFTLLPVRAGYVAPYRLECWYEVDWIRSGGAGSITC